MSGLKRSFIESANDPNGAFPLNNLPYGSFSIGAGARAAGVAIGERILNVTAMEEAGLLDLPRGGVFGEGVWNAFMALGAAEWDRLRRFLQEALAEGSPHQAVLAPHLVAMAEARLHMPFHVAEFTDFYSGRDHAFNVGCLFRDPENALPPNWLHIPIGYNGRASSVVVSGTDVVRPNGQLKPPHLDAPVFAASRRFDLELEMGAIVGTPSSGRVTVEQADAMIFGYVLLNDWSARDIQAWEYAPLGPFQAKATATTISPWIVTKAALEPFRTSTPKREKELLPYLHEPAPMLYDIDLEVGLTPVGGAETVLSRTNFGVMYYSAPQQLAHHTTSGCPMRVGDLLGSGTISGPEKGNRGSMLELSWGGREPVRLDSGEERSFLEDGDTVTLRGAARGDGYTIGFGSCSGTIRPAPPAD